MTSSPRRLVAWTIRAGYVAACWILVAAMVLGKAWGLIGLIPLLGFAAYILSPELIPGRQPPEAPMADNADPNVIFGVVYCGWPHPDIPQWMCNLMLHHDGDCQLRGKEDAVLASWPGPGSSRKALS